MLGARGAVKVSKNFDLFGVVALGEPCRGSISRANRSSARTEKPMLHKENSYSVRTCSSGSALRITKLHNIVDGVHQKEKGDDGDECKRSPCE
jgi:hypothetical protein